MQAPNLQYDRLFGDDREQKTRGGLYRNLPEPLPPPTAPNSWELPDPNIVHFRQHKKDDGRRKLPQSEMSWRRPLPDEKSPRESHWKDSSQSSENSNSDSSRHAVTRRKQRLLGGTPSFVRNRMSEMKSMIVDNDLEVRLDTSQPEVEPQCNIVWVRRRTISHPSSDVQHLLAKYDEPLQVKDKIGTPFPVVVIHEGKKLRAVLESDYVDENHEISYRDVDSGLTGTAPPNCLYRCSADILAIPPDAWRCQLDASETRSTSASLSEWTASRVRILKWSAVPTIRLLSTTEPEDEETVCEDFGHLFDFEQPSSATSSDLVQTLFEGLPGVSLPRSRLTLLEHCWIVNVQWPHVYLVKGDTPPDDLVSQRLVDGDLSLEGLSIDESKPNSICMVRVGKKLWRASVRRIKDKLASIVFVDNGKESEVPVSELLALPASLRNIQPACVKARLPDSYLDKLDEAALTVLTIAAGPLQAIITGYDEDIPMIRLYASGGREICVE